jgi:SAM-dependent methyltransferase
MEATHTSMTRLRTPWNTHARDWADVQEQLALPLYKSILSCLPVLGRCKLLDLGCGAGTFCAVAASIGVDATGLDSAPAMITLARERVSDAEFVLGEMMDLPYPAGVFHVVTAINSVQHATSARGVLREARRVARAGASIVIATLGPEDRCDATVVLRELSRLEAPASDDTPSPFALAQQGALEILATDAGLAPMLVEDVDCAWTYCDIETAVRGLMAGGAAVRAARAAGDAAVSRAIASSIAPFRASDGRFILRNRYRFMLAIAPDDSVEAA